MSWFDHALKGSTALATLVAGALMIAMMLHIMADVLSQWLFNFPLDGTLEIVSNWYMVGLIYLPLIYVQRRRSHIVAELFTQGLSSRAIRALEGVIGIFMFAYSVIFVWRTAVVAVAKTAQHEYLEATAVHIVIWPTRWFLPLGFGLMGLMALFQGVVRLRQVFHGDLVPEEPNLPTSLGGR